MNSLLANNGSREPTLIWISEALIRNKKRSLLGVESHLVASDGFFLNLASVMSRLSLEIKLDDVDFFYPFHPHSRLSIRNETRINANSHEARSWLEQLNRSAHVWQVHLYAELAFYLQFFTF